MIDITDTPHGLHLDTDGGTPVTLSPDAVAAIFQHKLGELDLWWAEEQRALIQTRPDDEGDHVVLFLDDLAGGVYWATVGVEATTPTRRRLNDTLAAYLASLPAAPKPGETWEIGTGADTHTAIVVEAPDGSACFVWHPHGDIAIRHVSRFEGNRRKIADAPSGADQ